MRAIHVANTILTLNDEEEGELISHLKLQKLLYYTQGIGLVFLKHPVFEEKIVAWQHGPVVPVIWDMFKQHGSDPIPNPKNFEPRIIQESVRTLIQEVYMMYGQYSAWKLRDMTHEEAPWIQTPVNDEITHDRMKMHFGRMFQYRYPAFPPSVFSIPEYTTEVDENALSAMKQIGEQAWKDVQNPSAWVEELRGS